MIKNNDCNRNHPLDKEYLRNLAKNSSRVVAWYPHSQYDRYHPGQASVRGPFCRWMLIEGGDSGTCDGSMGEGIADLHDDAKFAAAAMNNMIPLLDEIDRLEAEIKKLHDDWNTQARFQITDSARADRKIRTMKEVVETATKLFDFTTQEIVLHKDTIAALWIAIKDYKKEMATNQG